MLSYRTAQLPHQTQASRAEMLGQPVEAVWLRGEILTSESVETELDSNPASVTFCVTLERTM